MNFLQSDNKKNIQNKNTKVEFYNNRTIEILKSQRVLIYLNFLCLIVIFGLSIGIYKISQLRQFEPFVVQIEESSGQVSVIKSVDKEFLTTQDSLTRYFIKKYIIAREGYNIVDFEGYSRSLIKSFSDRNIYSQYLTFISNKENNPKLKYGDRNSVYIEVKSWSKLEKNKYIVRFDIKEMAEDITIKNKIAVVEVDYIPSNITEDQLDLNPIGFLVTGYNSSDDMN
ncbi:MAG: VirB8/TrbF family protein [Rickettsiales bacterium]